MNKKTIKICQQIQGASLLEVMVSLLIVSIGLLGIAALQSRTQQFNYASYVRTQSTLLAYEIMDQIQANSTFAKDDVINNGIQIGNGYIVNMKPTPEDCDTNSCTPVQLRNYDLARWYDRLAATLPAGTGRITAQIIGISPNQQVRYTISILWTLRDEERENPNIGFKTITWVMQI